MGLFESKHNSKEEAKAVQSSEKEITKRIREILSYLNRELYGKSEAIRLALLSVCANESIFFLDPPGKAN